MRKFLFGVIMVLILILSYTVSVGVYVYNGLSEALGENGAYARETLREGERKALSGGSGISSHKSEAVYKPENENEPHAVEAPSEVYAENAGVEITPGSGMNVLHKARISAVGDLMLHSYQYDNAYSKETGGYEFDSCFELVSPFLQASDIALGNLETVFGGPDLPYSDFPRFNAPDSFGQALKNAGFDLLITANNHQNDKGEAGILRTIDYLDSLGINHVGSYKSEEDRNSILLLEADSITFAFLSYTYGTNGLPLPEGKEYLINIMSESLIKEDLERAKELEPDYIIVLPHMGNEYETIPRRVFLNWVRFMFENGADIVLASHPHVVQGVEFVTVEDKDGNSRQCFAAYSLGNFISGQRTVPRDEGIILNMEFEKSNNGPAYISKVSYIPTWVMFTNGEGRPEVRILPVGEVLTSAGGKAVNVRPKDMERLKAVNENLKRILLGENAGGGEVLTEYTIYENK